MPTLDIAIRMTAIDRASAAIRGVAADIGRGFTGLEEASRKAGLGLSAAVTAPVILGINGVKDAVLDFEQQLNLLQATTEATDTQMAVIRSTAIALGADLNLPATSAANATDAMLQLARAGLSVTDTTAAARGTLQLAAAGQLEVNEAARITANALQAFGLRGTEATRVANLLAAAANSSSSEVRDLGFGFSRGAQAFATARIPIDQFVASLAILANAGVRSEDAGTSLKQFIVGLAPRTKPAAEAFKQLGISAFDAQGNMKPLTTIIADFQGALGRFSQLEQTVILRRIFGSDAERAAQILFLRSGTEGFRDMLAAVNRQGAAAALATAQNKGLRGALDGLSSAAETLAIQIFEPMLPTLRQIVLTVAEGVNAFGRLDPSVRNAAVAFVAVLAASGPLLLSFSGLLTALRFFVSPIGILVGALATLAALFGGNVGAIQRFLPGGRQMANVLEAISGALQPVRDNVERTISTLGDLVSAVFKFIGGTANFKLVTAAFDRLFGTNLTGNADLIQSIFSALGLVFQAVGRVVTTIVQPAFNALGAWFTGGGQGAIAGFTLFLSTQLVPALVQLAAWINGPVQTAVVAFGSWFTTTALPAIQAFTSWVSANVVPILQSIAQWIEANALPALQAFGNWFATDGIRLLAGFWTLLQAVGNFLVDLFGPAIVALAQNFGPLTSAVAGLLERLAAVINFLRPVAQIVGTILGALISVLPSLISQFNAWFDQMVSGFRIVGALFSGFIGAVTALARGDTNAALAAIASAWRDITQATQESAAAAGRAATAQAQGGASLGGFLAGLQRPLGTPGAGGGGASAFGGDITIAPPPGPPQPDAAAQQAALTARIDAFIAQIDRILGSLTGLEGSVSSSQRKVDDWNKTLDQVPANTRQAVSEWLGGV
jgi:TP901 family phage tail tape measure protein